MSKIGKPPPMPPNLGLPPAPPQTKDDASATPSIPPPNYKESLKAPSAPPPSYEESLSHPSGPPDLFTDKPLPNVAPPSYDEAAKLPSLAPKSGEAGSKAVSTKGPDPSSSVGPAPVPSDLAGLIESSDASTSEAETLSEQIEQVMAQLEGIKTASTMATYADLGLGVATEALNKAGLLDAYVVACKTAPVLQGAGTALSVLEGVKAVYDHQQIGSDKSQLEGQLNNAQKMKIVAKFVGHDDLLREVDRNAMVDRFLVNVLEGAQTDKELDALKAGLETAAGISSLTGALTGGAGLAVGAALELASLTVDTGRMIAAEHEFNQAEKSRKLADKDIARKYLHKWAKKVGAEPKVANPTRERDDPSSMHIETQRFTNSLWFKDDLAGIIVERMMEDPSKPIHQRILKLCDLAPDTLEPSNFNKLSPERQEKVLYDIRSKLSGEERIFDGKKKKFDLAVQAFRTDANDTFTLLRAEMAGYEGPKELAKFWNISTRAGVLYTMAEERGLDADAVVRGVLQAAQDEGPNCEKRLHDLLMFDGSIFSRDTTGSTAQGRMEARLELLKQVHAERTARPDSRLEACVQDVMVTTDKVLMAQSHEFKNITPYGESLFAMAENRGLEASALTTEIFKRAIDEGRESVEALHDLLAFKEGFWLNDETRGSTEADRMETRLELLQKLKATLDRGGIVSVQSASLDLARVEKKVEAAQDKFDTRALKGSYDRLLSAAQKQGVSAHELDQLFEKIVKEDATATFADFVSFDESVLNDETKGTTADGREHVQVELVRRLIQSLEQRPQRLESACRDVSLGYDKVHHAQSFRFANITSDYGELRQAVEAKGLDPDALVDAQFERAVSEGASSVRALKQMLEFRTSVISFNDETRGTSKSDRLETQVEMLVELEQAVKASRFTSVQSSALDVERVFNKGERAQQFALQHSLERAYSPWREGLEARSPGSGAKLDALIADSAREGSDAVMALRGMLSFSDSFWNDETSGSTGAGRFEAQLDLLDALVEFRDAYPESRVESAVSQVMVSRDKVFMAQSHEFANITEYAAALESHARTTGRDAERLVDGIMRSAVQEGPASVEALQKLLEFKSSKFSHYDQLRASTPSDRLETRLILLEKIEEAREASPGRSVQSAALDVARVTDKVKIARSFGRIRNLHPDADRWTSALTERGKDPEKVLGRLFGMLVDEGTFAEERFHDFINFQDSPFNDETKGTTAEGRLEAQLVLLETVESFLDAHPNSRATRALSDIARSHNKSFIAQSYQFANISPFATELLELSSGQDPDVVREVFSRAVDEGQASVDALNELLSFKESWFPLNDETRGSTHQDRLGVRLALIQQISDGLERNPKFTSVQSLALDLDRVENKVRLAQAPGQVRTIYAKSDALRSLALERGMDPDRVSTRLFEKMVDEGPQCVKAFHAFLHFDNAWHADQTQGTVEAGRMHARLTLMDALAGYVEANPDARIERAMREVALGHDKAFIARSYQYANITNLTPQLEALAEELGKDPKQLVSTVFDRAIAEGEDSVAALRELLSFDTGFFNSETTGSTHRDRLEARLILLERLCESLERGGIVSVQSAALDLERVTNKRRIAQSFGKLRDIHPLAGELRARAEAKGMDVNRVTTRIFEAVVAEGDEAIGELHSFLSFKDSWWNNECRGSTEEARLETRVVLMSALADFLDANPHARVTRGMREVAIGHDKVFIAQGQGFKNITNHAESLYERAKLQGLDAERLTTGLFKEAQNEGPSSVEALRTLLALNESLATKSGSLTQPSDFDDVRLLLLKELVDTLDGPGIHSIKSVALDLERVRDKDTMVVSFGKIRNFSPRQEALEGAALQRGVDPQRITTKLFEMAVHEGDAACEALRSLIHFDSSVWNDETKGSTKEGRLEARVTLLDALATEMERDPQPKLETACREVELGLDKVFLAQSYQYANITHLAGELRARAEERELDVERLVNGLFDQAQAEGPSSVEALRDLLRFDDSMFHDQTKGSTHTDRLDVRLNLLTELDRDLGRATIGSVQSIARDLARVRDKAEMAQAYGRVRSFNPQHTALVEMAKLRHMDVGRVTTDLYERAVAGDNNDVEALQGFLSYSKVPWDNETAGTTETGRLFALAGAMNALAEYFEKHPDAKMESAVRDVKLGYDKTFQAQSFRFANISKHAGKLYDLAQREGLDANRLVVEQMKRAVEEGPRSVEALRDLLSFSGHPFNMQTFGNTGAARLRARLELLKRLDESVNGGRLTSIQSSSLDVARITDKRKLATSLPQENFSTPLQDKLPDPLGRTVKATKVSNKLAPTRDTRFDTLFDFAAAPPARKPSKPGYLASIVRGTTSEPVFKDDMGGARGFFAKIGNATFGLLAREGDKALSGGFGTSKSAGASDERRLGPEGSGGFSLSHEASLGFSVKARRIPERDLSNDSPQRLGIEELRDEFPGAVPMWIEGTLEQELELGFKHALDLGAGSSLELGFTATQGAKVEMTRLTFLEGSGKGLVESGKQLTRLGTTPRTSDGVRTMETGARFKLSGEATMRLDAGLGIGASIPALGDALNPGARVSVGGYAALEGELELEVQKLKGGQVRVKLGKDKESTRGLRVSAQVGANLDKGKISKLLGDFALHAQQGGTMESFMASNPVDRGTALSMGNYFDLVNARLAEGAADVVLEDYIEEYTQLAFESHHGIEIDRDVDTVFHFDLESQERVVLPSPDMVPPELRKGRASGEDPTEVVVGEVASLAYDMAVRGDLRLVQQLSRIRGSGVRISEEKTTMETSEVHETRFSFPFGEYAKRQETSQTIVDRFTPELGKTRALIESFNEEFQGFFGDSHQAKSDIRVHSLAGQHKTSSFNGAAKNFSADFVVENHVDTHTSFEEMQNYMGILNGLSEGRLKIRCQEALLQGKLHDGDLSNDPHPMLRVFEQGSEYGRTTAHLHVWVGEAGLRKLLSKNVTEDELYGALGQVFVDMERYGDAQLPAWALPGADRQLFSDGSMVRSSFKDNDVYGSGDDADDLAVAKYLVDNLSRLRDRMRHVESPDQEEKMAEEIRNFLGSIENKLPAYSALAMLVPEHDRAVELRINCIKENQTPIRFSYVQDGRTPDLLYATGFAKCALSQFKQFGSLLDSETRLRIGNLLGELQSQLNAPSPDPFLVDQATDALKLELAKMDEVAIKRFDSIEKDLSLSWELLRSLPDLDAVRAVLPDSLGVELATMQLRAEHGLQASPPDYELLHSMFENIVKNLPVYREISHSEALVANTASMANALAEVEPELAQRAVDAMSRFRKGLHQLRGDSADTRPLGEARAELLTLNAELQASGTDQLDLASAVEVHRATQANAATVFVDRDTVGQRLEEAQRFEALAGNPSLAAVSYFEKTGVVPKTHVSSWTRNVGKGRAASALVTDAHLSLAVAKPQSKLGPPSLPRAKSEALRAAVRKGGLQEFLKLAEGTSFKQLPNFSDPKVALVEALLVGLNPSEREVALGNFGAETHSAVSEILADFESDTELGLIHQRRDEVLEQDPRCVADLQYLEGVARSQPDQLEAALNGLGYGKIIRDWHGGTTARLEGALSQVTGDELEAMVPVAFKPAMTNSEAAELKKLCDYIKRSDLRPQTRAKLVGGLVDNPLFYKHDELLAEALVTGMDHHDLRIFFDQLYKEGKVERFLDAGSGAQTALRVGTLALGYLFTYDNQAANAVVAKQGWSANELEAEYSVKISELDRLENRAQGVLLDSVVDPIPVAPIVKDCVRAANSVLRNVKYDNFQTLPEDMKVILGQMALNAGVSLVGRLGDIALQGGTPEEIAAEYEAFFVGLSPEAIRQEMNDPDSEGSIQLLSDSLQEGVKVTLRRNVNSSPWVTSEVVELIPDLA